MSCWGLGTVISCGTSCALTREARGRRPITALRSRTMRPPVDSSATPSGGRVTVRVGPPSGAPQSRQRSRSGGFAWPCGHSCPVSETSPGGPEGDVGRSAGADGDADVVEACADGCTPAAGRAAGGADGPAWVDGPAWADGPAVADGPAWAGPDGVAAEAG